MNPVRSLLAMMIVFLPPFASAAGFEMVRFDFELSNGLESPVDIAVTPHGDLLILDAKTRVATQYARDGRRIQSFGGRDLLSRPVALAAGPDGSVAIADERQNEVLLFSADGALQTRFGGGGRGPGEFRKLADVAFDSYGFVYTADAGNRTVARFSAQGVLLAETSFSDLTPSVLSVDRSGMVTLIAGDGPRVLRFSLDESVAPGSRVRLASKSFAAGGLHVDDRGDIYLTRSRKNNVMKFSATGEVLAAFGSRGKGPGAFSMPGRMAGDGRGEVYIVDTKNRRVQGFSISGPDRPDLPPALSSPATATLSGYESLNEAVDDLVLLTAGDQLRLFGDSGRLLMKGLQSAVIGDEGRKAGEFRDPGGAAALPDGRVVIADTGNNRLQIVDASGASTVIGDRGKDPGFFSAPSDVAVNSQGLVYVADTGNSRVQIFNDQGIYMHNFGVRGKSKKDEAAPLSAFSDPVALVVDSGNRVHVLDPGNERVVIFDPRGNPLRAVSAPGQVADLAVDENDYLYLADNACHCVLVYDTVGRQVLRLGGAGSGAGQFGEISAIAARAGELLVADGASRPDLFSSLLGGVQGRSGRSDNSAAIKTFRLQLDGVALRKHFSVTHSFYVPESAVTLPDEFSRYRDLALDKAAVELAEIASRPVEEVRAQLSIESERSMPGGEVRMVVSIPVDSDATETLSGAEEDLLDEAEEGKLKLVF